MPRRSKGARLYLRERKGREATYVIRYGSDEISTGFGPDESERANQALAEYLAAHFRHNTGERDLAKISIAEVLDLYQTDIAPSLPSRATIGYHVKALLPFWGEKTLADVKGSTCRLYASYRATDSSATALSLASRPGIAIRHNSKKRSVSFSTVRRELKTLQAAINHWHRESPLAAVPKVTLPPEGARRERVLERNEVAAMLRAARRLKLNHVARFILIGVYTGTRHNAILSLRWMPGLAGGHVDLQRGIIYRRGFAERETRKRRPPVSIPARLRAHMSRWATADERAGTVQVISYNGAAISKERRGWAHVVKKAGLGKDVTPHVLRHTCASWLLWEGKTIWDVAGIIGADASTVDRVYGHHRIQTGANLGREVA